MRILVELDHLLFIRRVTESKSEGETHRERKTERDSDRHGVTERQWEIQ